eukprot:SAG31_NODE_38662_length_294_cov_1.056410_1_plen_47_part_00
MRAASAPAPMAVGTVHAVLALSPELEPRVLELAARGIADVGPLIII